MFLTAKQLEDLTGLTQGAAQIRWLQKNGVLHYVRVDGKPRVPETAVRKPETQVVGPNFEAIRAKH